MSDPSSFLDFTRANYRRLTEMAMARYRLVPVIEWEQAGNVAVWRHDVDLSPQAALTMGRVEAGLGVRSTYYFNLRSDFYHVLEAAVASIVRELAQLGHEIGLHFDAGVHDLSNETSWERALRQEADVLSTLLDVEIRSFSLHNPDSSTARCTESTYAGLLNAYASDLLSTHPYCSDSNGYWRFTPLEEFLGLGHPAVYVLTHPGWWQDEAMSPRNRVVRCVEGRAEATLRAYDEQLQRSGRINIR
jgi:hypothetical protein